MSDEYGQLSIPPDGDSPWRHAQEEATAARSGLVVEAADSGDDFLRHTLETGARAFLPFALATDPRAFQQQTQHIGGQFGLIEASAGTELGQAVAMVLLDLFDHALGRMIVICQFDSRIGHLAAAPVAADALGRVLDPGSQLRFRITGMLVLQFIPLQIGFLGGALQTLDDEIVLGGKMTIERHLVRAGGLGDRFDADAAHAVLVKHLPRGGHDTLSRPRTHTIVMITIVSSLKNLIAHGLTSVLPVSNYLAVTER